MACYEGASVKNTFGNFTDVSIRPFGRDPADNESLSFVVLDRRPSKSNKVFIFMSYYTNPHNSQQKLIKAYDRISGEILFFGELTVDSVGPLMRCFLENDRFGEVRTLPDSNQRTFVNFNRPRNNEYRSVVIRPLEGQHRTKCDCLNYGFFSRANSFLAAMHEEKQECNWSVTSAQNLEDEEAVMVMLVAVQLYVEKAQVANRIIPIVPVLVTPPPYAGPLIAEPIRVLFLAEDHKVDIRGAGYREQTGTITYYFDVISEKSQLVEFNIEYKSFEDGNITVVAKDKRDKECFNVTDIFGNNMAVHVSNALVGTLDVPQKQLLSKVTQTSLALNFEKSVCNTEKVTITQNSKLVGEIDNTKGYTASVTLANMLQPLEKMCIFGFAMRHALENYRLADFPVPPLDYKYNIMTQQPPAPKSINRNFPTN